MKKLKKHFDTKSLALWIDLFDIDFGCVWNPKAIIKMKYLNDKL